MSFRKYFKDYWETKLKELLPQFNRVIVVNDATHFYTGQQEFLPNDLVVVLSIGNNVRTNVSNDLEFFTGSSMIQFYCIDYEKENVINVLTDLFSNISASGHSELIGGLDNENNVVGYKVSFNFNTPSSDSVQRIFSGINVAWINAIGTFTYFDMNANVLLNIPKIMLNGTELSNVISYSVNSSATTKDYNVQGSRFIKRFEDLENVSYNITLVLDFDNDLHKQLSRIANKFKKENIYYSNFMQVEIIEKNDIENISTGIFDSFIQISSDYQINNFTALNITISR